MNQPRGEQDSLGITSAAYNESAFETFVVGFVFERKGFPRKSFRKNLSEKIFLKNLEK